MNKTIEISIVTTVYKSEKFLPQFISDVITTIRNLNNICYELIFVIDGITDNSKEYLLSRKKELSTVKIIELSRNFGHHYAALAGLSYARGNKIMLIDCDLEVNPSIMKEFYTILEQEEADVVYGYQEIRKGALLEKYFGAFFWKMFNYLSETKIPENIITERLMTKQYVSALISLNDKNLFLGGMMYWAGFKQIGIPVIKINRNGKSTYSLRKRIALMINAIASFTAYPLKVLFYIGLMITFLSFLLVIYFIIKKIIYPDLILSGYTSLITAIIFSTGVIVSSIGTIGIYLEKIFTQVKNRPTFIIKKIL